MIARRSLRWSLPLGLLVSVPYLIGVARSSDRVFGPRGDLVAAAVPSPSSEAPFIKEELLPGSGAGMVHVASLAERPNGRLAAVWYGGSREAAADVALFLALQQADSAWSTPRVLVDRETVSREEHRYVGKVGNAVLFSDAASRLWLVYVAMPFGGWSTSALSVKVSADGGLTWTASRRIRLSPFFDLGTLVKNKPLALWAGGFLLPVEHGLLGKFPEIVVLRGEPGRDLVWSKARVWGGRSYHQPALVAVGPREALCLLRAVGAPGRIGLSVTADAGATWSPPRATGLPNPDSGLDGVALAHGGVLVAFNDDPLRRCTLRLAVSSDGGANWTRVATLENEIGAEFSYPFLLRTRDGAIHVVYTWKRRAIKHVVFNEAWLEARGSEVRN